MVVSIFLSVASAWGCSDHVVNVKGTVYISSDESEAAVSKRPFPTEGEPIEDAVIEYRQCKSGCEDQDWEEVVRTDDTGWYEIKRKYETETERIEIRAVKDGYKTARFQFKNLVPAPKEISPKLSSFIPPEFIIFRLSEVPDA